MHQVTIAVSGMSCDGCVRAVRTALEAVPGVQVNAVTIGSATVAYDEREIRGATLVQAIQKAGYQPMASGVPITPMVEDPVRCRCGRAHGHAPSGKGARS